MSQTQIIKELKEFLGFTNKSKATKQLSELLGVSTEAIYLWEKDKCKINVHKIIEKIPNISAEFLLGRSKEIEFKQEPEKTTTENLNHICFFTDDTVNKLPSKNNPSDSGYDICWNGYLKGNASKAGAYVMAPGSVKVFQTGVSCVLPKGKEIQVRSRSGLASKGITVNNSPGTVDNNYTGELMIILANTSNESYTISINDKIAQLVLADVLETSVSYTSGKASDYVVTDRGTKGLGDSGK